MSLQMLLEKKKHWGFLEGLDALQFLRHLQANSSRWTDEHWRQLTNFMMGKPVKRGFQFEVVAGKPIQQVSPSRAHQTVAEKFADRRAKKAAKQRRRRHSKIALQTV